MDVHGIFRQSCRYGNLCRVHALHEPKQENRALALGKITGCFPRRPDLFVHQRVGFRREAAVRKALADDGWIHGGVLDLAPELKPPISSGLSDGIHRDLHQPRVQTRFAPKRVPAPIGAPKAVLGQGFGRVAVADRRHDKSKDARPIVLHDPIEILDFCEGALHA